MMQLIAIYQWARDHWRVLLAALVLLIILFLVGLWLWHRNAATETKLQQAVVLTQQQATDLNTLQNKLQESKQNAEMLAEFVKKAQTGQVQPAATFVAQAPTVEQAAQDVATRINESDPSLPPVAIEKTDRTVVTTAPLTDKQKTAVDKFNEQNKNTGQPPVNDQYQVQVYKVNNYRNWEWSGGYGQHGGDRYIPVEVRRDFSKDQAVSYEQHFGGHSSGFEVKYTIKTDKLFGIF